MQSKFSGLVGQSPKASKVVQIRSGAYSLTTYAKTLANGHTVKAEHRARY